MFIDNYRFMAMPLSKLVDNLSEGIHNNKCVDCKSCLDYVRSTKNEKLILKYFNCETFYRKKFNKELIKRFASTYEFCNKSFYSNLNIENIDDIDYRHGNNVFKIFKLKNLGEYHDLYVQRSDTLLLAEVFENFRNKCLEVYELDPAHFIRIIN